LVPHILFSNLFPNILKGLPNLLENSKRKTTKVGTSKFKWGRDPNLETYGLKPSYVGELKSHERLVMQN
jgi:hypothetical protein